MDHRGVHVAWDSAIAWLVMALLLLAVGGARAAGTPAGTLIPNSATLTYSMGGKPQKPIVAVAPVVTVARLVSVVVTWQDGNHVPANSPDLDRPLSFLVTNTGNGTDTFRLSRDDALAGDQFNPVASQTGPVWLESGAQAGFQATGPNADIAYIPGANDPSLRPDESRVVYLLSAIPAGQGNGAVGRAQLAAASTLPGAAEAAGGTPLGTVRGVPTLVGPKGARASATGSYLVAGVAATLAKSVTAVADPAGGRRVMPGSVLTYRLVLSLTGTGVANGMTVRDPLPPEVTYVRGSLTVDGATRTDAADTDDAQCVDGVVQASFGSVQAPAQRVIEFKAKVN